MKKKEETTERIYRTNSELDHLVFEKLNNALEGRYPQRCNCEEFWLNFVQDDFYEAPDSGLVDIDGGREEKFEFVEKLATFMFQTLKKIPGAGVYKHVSTHGYLFKFDEITKKAVNT